MSRSALLALLLSPALAAVTHGAQPVGDAAAVVEEGRQTFEYWCAPCHADGPGSRGPLLPGTYALQLKYKGQVPALLEQRTDLSEPVLKLFVRRGSWSMPGFRKTEISDRQITALAAYIANTSAGPRPAQQVD